MALPINKPSVLPSFDEETPVVRPPVSPGFLRLPEGFRDEETDEEERPAIPSLRGKSLSYDQELLDDEVAARKEKIGTVRSNGLVDKDFHISTVLNADDLINGRWEDYAYLMPKVVEVKEWLQDILSEQDLTTDIAEARAQRGTKYREMKAIIDTLLVKYFAQEKVIQGRDGGILMTLVANEMLGLGPIEPLWQDDRISEIMVNGPGRIRIEIAGKLLDVPGAQFRDAEHLLDVCQQILAPVNRVIDISHPYEDGRLVDGSRVNITHPVIGPAGPFLTIRRFPDTTYTLQKLVELGSMSEDLAVEVANLIAHGCSTVISGGTGTGKTSTLNALSGCIPPDERVITIEDNLELKLHPDRDVVALEARKGTGDKNSGAVTIRDLVRNALRMRPDRIVVGEVRDGAAYDMLQAMNTGHDGSMTTVHANDAYGAIERLVNLITEAGEIDDKRSMSLIAGGVDVIVTIERYEDGSRRCSGVYEIPNRVTANEDGIIGLEPRPLFEFVQDGLDENEKILGHYERVEEISDSMIRKHRLNKKKRLTLDEIYLMSEEHDSL